MFLIPNYVLLVAGVLLISSINDAIALRCYTCSSKVTEDCIKPDTNRIKPVLCDGDQLAITNKLAKNISQEFEHVFSVDGYHNLPFSCLKQITKDGNKDYVIRGCHLAQSANLDICKKVKEKNNPHFLLTVHCSGCMEEECNAASEIQIRLSHLLVPILLQILLFNYY